MHIKSGPGEYSKHKTGVELQKKKEGGPKKKADKQQKCSNCVYIH